MIEQRKKDKAFVEELFRKKFTTGESPMGTVLAELSESIVMERWNGHDWKQHGHKAEQTPRVVSVGTTVMVWMVSRFGDIGINDDLNAKHYDARVKPDKLENLRHRKPSE